MLSGCISADSALPTTQSTFATDACSLHATPRRSASCSCASPKPTSVIIFDTFS